MESSCASILTGTRHPCLYDDALASFVPDKAMQRLVCVGAAAGKMNLVSAIADTLSTVTACLSEDNFKPSAFSLPLFAASPDYHLQPLWHVMA